MKRSVSSKTHCANVTPCVGVWIETITGNVFKICKWSHPAWVCGLKQLHLYAMMWNENVTPCVGVWIETPVFSYMSIYSQVTPCVGVWIETL